MNATDRLDALVEQVRTEPEPWRRALVADVLREQLLGLVRGSPTQPVRDRLVQLLEERSVDPFVDSRDFPCRAAVIEALSLKASWARELAPADLDLLRRASTSANDIGGRARVVTPIVAGLSLVWNGTFLALFVPMLAASPMTALVALPFLIATGHALATLVRGAQLERGMTRTARTQARARFLALGWCWPVGAGAAVIFGAENLVAGLVVLGFALPALATTACCFWLSIRIAPNDAAVLELLLHRRRAAEPASRPHSSAAFFLDAPRHRERDARAVHGHPGDRGADGLGRQWRRRSL